jgi:hypothetical protein
MEIINAEYSWNVRSTGFYRDPERNAEAIALWRRYMSVGNEPEELLRPGGLFHVACELLYGPRAGPVMARYYQTSQEIPDVPEPPELKGRYSYLPMTFNRAYPTPSHWRHLALDAKTWGGEINNEAYARSMQQLKIDRKELHRRLAHRWGVVGKLSRSGAALITEALAAGPPPGAVEDLQFLQTSFRVYQPLIEGLEHFHTALRLRFSESDAAQWQGRLRTALSQAKEAQQLADRSFPQPIDPIGAEVGSLRKHARRLVETIEMWMNTEPGRRKS